MSNNHSERGGGGFFAGFVAGTVIGAVVAYLITQEEARDLIVGKAREAGNLASSWQSNAADLYERGKSVVEGARSNMTSAMDEGQAASERVRTELSHQPSEPLGTE